MNSSSFSLLDLRNQGLYASSCFDVFLSLTFHIQSISKFCWFFLQIYLKFNLFSHLHLGPGPHHHHHLPLHDGLPAALPTPLVRLTVANESACAASQLKAFP